MPEPAEERQILIHGPNCPEWTQPRTVAEWEAVELVEETEDDGATVWRCPLCGVPVIVLMDGGPIDFGVLREAVNDESVAFFETFEPVVTPRG